MAAEVGRCAIDFSTMCKQGPHEEGIFPLQESLDDGVLGARIVFLANASMPRFRSYLEEQMDQIPAMQVLLKLYPTQRESPGLGDFRLGPSVIEKIPLHWILVFSSEADPWEAQLIGHAMTTAVSWNGELEDLPQGWQGSVRRSYQDLSEHKNGGTLVGLFVRIENEFQRQGWAATVITKMKALAKRLYMNSLIIPVRPPMRYRREFAAMPFSEFASLKREDGEPLDHWIRLHTRMGGAVLGVCSTSHQHVFGLGDLSTMFGEEAPQGSGYKLIQQPDGGWCQVYVDLEREVVSMNQGCVWIKHGVG